MKVIRFRPQQRPFQGHIEIQANGSNVSLVQAEDHDTAFITAADPLAAILALTDALRKTGNIGEKQADMIKTAAKAAGDLNANLIPI